MDKNKIILIIALLAALLLISIAVAPAVKEDMYAVIFGPQAQPVVIKERISGHEIPALTEDDKITAKEIVLNDPDIRDIINGRSYEIVNIGVWHKGTEKLGASIELQLDKNYWMERNWTYPKGNNRLVKTWVQNILVSVDLKNETVAKMIPMGGRIDGKTPEDVFVPEIEKAKDIAFSDIIVKAMLKGKNYTIETDGVWYPENIAAFTVNFDKSYNDEYTIINKGKTQSAVIQAVGLSITVDLGTAKVVDIQPVIGGG